MNGRRATFWPIVAASIVISVLAALAPAGWAMPIIEKGLAPQEALPSIDHPAARITTKAQPPALPSSFYGTVTLNGEDAPEGTLIAVGNRGRVYAELACFIDTDTGRPVYSIDVPADDPATPERDGGIQDEVLQFTVGGLLADRAPIWDGGTTQERPLAATEPRLYLPLINRVPHPTIWWEPPSAEMARWGGGVAPMVRT